MIAVNFMQNLVHLQDLVKGRAYGGRRFNRTRLWSKYAHNLSL